jgi:hypothetical protein
MLFPKRSDYRVLTTAWAHGTTYQLTLSREFWLECIWLAISFTSTGAATTPTADALLNLIKRVRLSATDATGNRKIVDSTGSALVEYWRNTNGSLGRQTASLIAANPASGSFTLMVPIPFRHPQLQDPWGAATMLPLPRLSSDPVLEVEVGAATDIAATIGNICSTKGSLVAIIERRDVLAKDFPYIPSELITYDRQWSSSGGKQDWEIPALGTLTGLLIQDYAGGTARSTVLGVGATADEIGQDWSVEFLSSVIRRAPARFLLEQNDASADLYPGTWINPTGSYYMDFLTDYSGNDAFNLGSCLDLNPLALNGGKARVIASSVITTAGSFSRFTAHKLFGDLRAMKFA